MMEDAGRNVAFKRCPSCGKQWSTRDEFIDDESLQLNGYTADFEDLEYGLFFFTHEVNGCYSTMTMEVKGFLDLYQGKRYTKRKAEAKGCPRYCMDAKQLARCNMLCECAFAREIMHIIRTRKQVRAAAS